MIQNRAKGLVTCRQLVEIAVAQLVFWGGCWLFIWATAGEPVDCRQYGKYAIAMLVGMLVNNNSSETKLTTLARTGWIQNHFQSSRLVAFVAASFLLLLGAEREADVSRGFLLIVAIALYPAALVANRWLVRPIAAFSYASRRDLTLALGRKSESIEWKTWLKEQRELGLDVVNAEQLLCGVDRECPVGGLPDMAALRRFTETQPVAQILLLELPEDRRYLQDLVALCNQKGIRMLIVHDLHEQIGHSVCFFSHNGVHLISLRNEPLENPVNRLIKRGFDIVFSVVALFFTMLILGPVVWWAQRLQSPGPLFFRQVRSGLKNGHFRMLKFRTMHTGHDQEAKQACDGDVRIFAAGRVMRKFSMDEAPQFWNVLKGEMSIVGPRPHLVEHNEAFERVLAHYNVRTLVPPGITGLAQIRGFRGETPAYEDIERRVSSDIYYIEKWSFALDLLIVAKTVVQVLRPPRSAK